jgi:glycine hydroxymethyltransferase
MTTRGFGPDEFQTVARLIDRVLQSPEDEGVRRSVRAEVEDLCERFPLYDFVVA